MVYGTHLVSLMAMAQGLSEEQPATVNGTVVDAKGNGLGGVKAELMDCFTRQVTKIVIADAKGNFTLVPDAGAHAYCLRFSSGTFVPMEMSVDAQKMSTDRWLHVQVPAIWAGKMMN